MVEVVQESLSFEDDLRHVVSIRRPGHRPWHTWDIQTAFRNGLYVGKRSKLRSGPHTVDRMALED
jgi:5-methylcytosine-specific restriction endonuclease McrA